MTTFGAPARCSEGEESWLLLQIITRLPQSGFMLSELQKQKLTEFNQDELMMDTVFKVLYSFVELNELDAEVVKKSSNAQLGQIVRGNFMGAEYLRAGMKEIITHKKREL